MLTRLIEFLLISLFNLCRSAVSALAGRRRSPAALKPGNAVLGHTIPTGNSEKPQPVTLSPPDRLRHLYVLGATGTGKTNLLLRLVSSDIEERRTLCLLDLRGDLVDRVLLRLAQIETPETLARRLLLIDLRSDTHVVGFNPLSDGGDVYARAMHVLSVLKRQADSWGVQLEETLRNSLISLAETNRSLLEIEPLLTVPTFRESVLSKVSDSYVLSFFRRFGELSAERQAAWALPVLNKVTPLLAVPQLRLMFGSRQTFSFGDILDKEPGSIILISLAADRLHEASHLVGGLFVSAFQAAVMSRVDQPEGRRVPVHLYVDEFETMATERFESIVAEGRRFGAGLCLSHQNLSQLPTNLRHVLRNNVHTHLYFQTGALDAKELSSEVGGAEPKESVRASLISQAVGEAYLVRRGEPTARIRVCHSPDPKVNAATVMALQEASYAVYARPHAEAEQELLERIKEFEQLHRGRKAPAEPIYEIRHGKEQGQFRPERKE